MSIESGSSPIDHRTTLREGGRILGLLLVWGSLAAIGYFGPGTLGAGNAVELSKSLAFVFATLGLLCTFFYVVARGIQFSGRQSM